jgi:hypothetical protein
MKEKMVTKTGGGRRAEPQRGHEDIEYRAAYHLFDRDS